MESVNEHTDPTVLFDLMESLEEILQKNNISSEIEEEKE
jgi:hypothetical protein